MSGLRQVWKAISAVLFDLRTEMLYSPSVVISSDPIRAVSVFLDESDGVMLTIQREWGGGELHEDFLSMVETRDAVGTFRCDGSTLAALGVIGPLEKAGHSGSDCVAFTYDGASALSGEDRGARSYVETWAPKCIFTHCCEHNTMLGGNSAQRSCKLDPAGLPMVFLDILLANLHELRKHSLMKTDEIKKTMQQVTG